jgi:V/A-type H+-transporting ATPase subunit E
MENLKARLEFTGKIEIKEIIEEANNQAAKLLSEAKAKAQQVRTKETEEILQKLREKETQELESSRLQRKRAITNLRSQLVEAAFAGSFEKAKKLVEQAAVTYRKSLEKSIALAVVKTEGVEFELILNPIDIAYVKTRLKRIEKEVSTVKNVPVTLRVSDEPLQSVGGVVIRSCDEKQIFNNTLEARFAKIKQEAVFKVSEILFEGAKE